MKIRFHSAMACWAAVALLAAVATPAAALTKEQKHDEMIAISAQISAIKANPASAAQVQQLQARYDQLSASLGGDDPGEVFAGAAAPSPEGPPPAGPPNCATVMAREVSTDTPLAITSNSTTTSTITVAGVPTYLLDINVTTEITHTFNADLDITVTSPAGTVIVLTTDNGGGSDDVFNGTVWDDDGGDTNPPGAITDTTFVNGVVETPLVPEEALGAFLGEDPNGTWQIDIFDDAGGDEGNLAAWTVDIISADGVILDPVISETSTDTPLPIPSNATTTSMISVAGAVNPFVCDVHVTTDMIHTFAADLDITVTSPAGTVSTLTTDNGGGSDDVFAGTLWDDDAGVVITDFTFTNGVAATPLTPEEALGAFIGENPDGTWQIDVADDAGGDEGNLRSWTVDITTCSCTLPETDLTVFKSGELTGATEVTWTIGIENMGPDDATNIVVTDVLDPCSAYVSDSCGGMNLPPWTWNAGNMPNGAIQFCQVVVDISGCGGSISNTATVSGDENDPNPGNNSFTAEVMASPIAIPTLGSIGLALLAVVLALGALVLLRRRTTA